MNAVQNVKYDFPVSLQEAFTRDRKQIPGVRAVVRDDTNEPLTYVSQKFALIPHAELVDRAQDYMKLFGEPSSKFTLNDNGCRLLCEFSFQDKALAVSKGDFVGLKILIENAYNAARSLVIKIGGIRLSCMNGQTVSDDVFSLTHRHIGEVKIEWPKPEEIFSAFQTAVNNWQKLSLVQLEEPVYNLLAGHAVEATHVGSKVTGNLNYEANPNAWGLYNDFTSHVSHVSKAKAFGKINQQNRIDKWFNNTFIADDYRKVLENASAS